VPDTTVKIALDGPVPTEPGWYFVNWAPPAYSDSWYFVRVEMLHGDLCAIARGDAHGTLVTTPALWSRRIEVGV
jgi:hypothetical protein